MKLKSSERAWVKRYIRPYGYGAAQQRLSKLDFVRYYRWYTGRSYLFC